jgi:FlaA1/EpsC-like NDP-sugar epimerase
VFTGIRPGEKLFEELQTAGERMIRTRHPKIFIGRLAAYPEQKIRHALERLSILADNGWEGELRKTLNDLLPEAQLPSPGEGFADDPPVAQVSQRVGSEILRTL